MGNVSIYSDLPSQGRFNNNNEMVSAYSDYVKGRGEHEECGQQLN